MGKTQKWETALNTYSIIRQLGSGGNGHVYLVKDKSGHEYALKQLAGEKGKGKAYKRFRDEIHILSTIEEKTGIIPLTDSFLPETTGTHTMPFYIMPVATPIETYLRAAEDNIIYVFMMQLTETLVYLHSKGITHRDIKPANMLVLNGKPVFSDFGLANFPNQQRASSVDEIIGAKWTIAPEMQRQDDGIDYKKADIYSLAKSLWMLITRQDKAFEGQYVKNSPISIKRYIQLSINETIFAGQWYYHSVVLLEKLLADSTSNDPIERPEATDLLKRLLFWYNSNENFLARNVFEWEDAIEQIFPVSIPLHVEWKKLANIAKILKILLDYDNLTHMFYPSRGGLDLESVLIYKEQFLELNGDVLINPVRLEFDMIDELYWSYFRIELGYIEFITGSQTDVEEVYKLEDGSLVSEEEAEGIDLSRRLISKYRNGSFIITNKTGALNSLGGQYDGYNGMHNLLTSQQYRDKIEFIKNEVKKKRIKID